MTTFDRITLLAIRLTGITQVLLGIAIWTGLAPVVIPVHMLIGTIFVLGLAVLGIRGVAKGSAALGLLAVGWGVLTVTFGMAQAQLLPGPHHWVIRLLHLLVGIAAMGIADRLSRRMKAARSAGGRVMIPA